MIESLIMLTSPCISVGKGAHRKPGTKISPEFPCGNAPIDNSFIVFTRVLHRRDIRYLVAALASFIVSSRAMCPNQCSGQEPKFTRIERRVERTLRQHANKSGVAGIAFGLVQDESIIVECYVGYASQSDKRRIDSSSVFYWASLSKGLSAVCALKLHEQGQLKLDCDLEEYIPELQLQAPVTLRQILCHQGGIGGYDVYRDLFELNKLGRESLTQHAILEKMVGKEQVYSPGSRLGYSSPGYILLSIAIERATEKPFADVVDELIAKPLQLTTLRVGGVSEADVVRYRLSAGTRVPVEDSTVDWRLGAGAVKSNLRDAMTFASALIQSSILTPANSRELFKRRAVVDNEGVEEGSAGVTYGFMRAGVGPESSIFLLGKQPGAKSMLVIYPRQQIASVIFANTTPVEIERIQLAAMKALTNIND